MPEPTYRASRPHRTTHRVFRSWAEARHAARRLRYKHLNDHRRFLPVMSPAGIVVATRDLTPKP